MIDNITSDYNVKYDLELYQSIKNRAITEFYQGNLENSVDCARVAALSAWQCHCGLWYDDDLDNLLKKIGISLIDSVNAVSNKPEPSKIAYITSAINVGGLTRLLNQWMVFLNKHFTTKELYITNTYTSHRNFYCTQNTFKDPELQFYNLSCHKKYTDRIKELIELLIKEPPEQVILFIDPDDVIAISAINAAKHCLKELNHDLRVIYVNHADHAFWLGRNIINTLVNFRKEGALFSEKYRRMNSLVIPISSNIQPKKVSKDNFNIDNNSTISLSVGTFPKVMGHGKHNYFRTITRLLREYPNHYHFFITNPPKQDILNDYLPDDDEIRRRFVVAGPFPDLVPYYGVADFLIETFPLTGYTVQVEAMSFHLPIVAFKNEKFPLFSSTANMPSYPFTATTEEGIINLCGKLIKNQELREELGNQLYTYYSREMEHKRVYSLLKDMINDGINYLDDVTDGKENDGVEDEQIKSDKMITDGCSYDINESRVFCANLKPYKQLLLQSILKKSTFSIKERIEFFKESIRRNEFDSRIELYKYIIPLIFGRNHL